MMINVRSLTNLWLTVSEAGWQLGTSAEQASDKVSGSLGMKYNSKPYNSSHAIVIGYNSNQIK